MTPTLEQIKEILANAPEGATHYVHADNEYWDLARKNNHPKVWDDYWIAVCYESTAPMDIFSASRLSDLRTIAHQAEEVEALKAHGKQLSSNLLWLAETVETDFIPNLEDYMDLEEHIDSIKALANQSPQTTLAERDAKVAQKAFKKGFMSSSNNASPNKEFEHFNKWPDESKAEELSKEYAERVKRGDA